MIKLVGLIAKQSVGDKFVVNFLPPSNHVQKNDKNLKNVNDLEKSGYKRQALIYLSFTSGAPPARRTGPSQVRPL